MRFFEKVVLVARRVDDNGVKSRQQRSDFVCCLFPVGGELFRRFGRFYRQQFGNRQFQVVFAAETAAVFDIVGKGALASVRVDDRYPETFLHQLDRQVHGYGRFAGSAFFVADNDYMSFAVGHFLIFPPSSVVHCRSSA